MAGTGFKLFANGEVLNASDVNTYLQQQTVMVFASAAARTTALSGVLAEGMCSYLQDDNTVYVYNGSAWVNIGNSGDITGVTAGTGLTGGGTSGDVTLSIDSTVATLSGSQTLTNKTISSGILTGTLTAGGSAGTSGQVLSSTGTGVQWATASGGGGMTLINETVASGNTAINIGSIPNTYKHLKIIYDGLYFSTTGSYYGIRVNADSGSNYAGYYFGLETTTPIGFYAGNQVGTALNTIGNQGNTQNTQQTCYGVIDIYNYASTTAFKQYESRCFWYSSNNSRTNWETNQGAWTNASTAISSIDFFRGNGTATMSNISNTSIRVYGVS